jgi:hypothetical protein
MLGVGNIVALLFDLQKLVPGLAKGLHSFLKLGVGRDNDVYAVKLGTNIFIRLHGKRNHLLDQ